MIRLTDPTRIGQSLAEVRKLLGFTRRGLAREIAAATGRTETSVNSQLWTWDVGDTKPGGLRPDLRSLKPYLDALDFDLALVDKVDPDAPRTWPRLDDPPEDVTQVRSADGKVWTRMDGGHWCGADLPVRVPWATVLGWGPVTEVRT